MTVEQPIGSYEAGYRWTVGAYEDDNWIATTATMTVRRAKGIKFDIWLPNAEDAKATKTLQILFEDELIMTVDLIRGQNNYIYVPFPTPAIGRKTLEILSEYREVADGDVRELAFFCNEVIVDRLDEGDIDVFDDDDLGDLDDDELEDDDAIVAPYDPRPPYFVFPDYRATNPYQTMIERNLSDDYAVAYTDIDGAIEHMISRQSDDARRSVFHLHWATSVISPAKNAPDAMRRVKAFLTRIDAFIQLGGIVIWTVHNTIPHDAKYLEAEIALNQGIADRAHRVHIHSRAALPQIEEYFSIIPDKILEIQHPSYAGVYPDYVTRDSARRALGIDPDVPTFVFLGQLRPYKASRRSSPRPRN